MMWSGVASADSDSDLSRDPQQPARRTGSGVVRDARARLRVKRQPDSHDEVLPVSRAASLLQIWSRGKAKLAACYNPAP